MPSYFFLCSLQAYNYTEHLYFCALNSSPPTHFTRAPPSPAKNRYLNSRLMILHASDLATELFDEVQSPRCTSIATAKLPAWSRHVLGIMQYKMVSNIQLTTGRDRENRWFDIAVSLKTKFKRHILEEFHGYSWVVCPGYCSR